MYNVLCGLKVIIDSTTQINFSIYSSAFLNPYHPYNKSLPLNTSISVAINCLIFDMIIDPSSVVFGVSANMSG